MTFEHILEYPLCVQIPHTIVPWNFDIKDLDAIFSSLETLGNLKNIAEQERVYSMESMDTSDPLEGGGGDILRLEYQV